MDTHVENQQRHVLIINNGRRRAYALEAAAYSLGRDPSNAIVLDFETISRQHAMLLRVPLGKGGYQYRLIDGNLEGKASANGVYVNETRCKSHNLQNGDTITLGRHIGATYMTLSMGEAEFVNYLESVSYQSIKSDLLDAKATMVSMDMENSQGSSVVTAVKPSINIERGSGLAGTLHDDAIKDSKATTVEPKSEQEQGRPTIKLWMAIAAALGVVGIGAGCLLLNLQSVSGSQSGQPSSAVRK
jgi:pSer/pThr/pTyr-binding forkhead associated (FHA) protein